VDEQNSDKRKIEIQDVELRVGQLRRGKPRWLLWLIRRQPGIEYRQHALLPRAVPVESVVFTEMAGAMWTAIAPPCKV